VQANVERERDPERFLARFGRRIQESRIEQSEGPIQEADESLDRDGEDGERGFDSTEDGEGDEVVRERKGESEPARGETVGAGCVSVYRMQKKPAGYSARAATYERMVR
jgi:hypothetical protein